MCGWFARFWPPPDELEAVEPDEQTGRVPGLVDESN